MAEEIKELIEKIQEQGVKAAQEAAAKIKSQADAQAQRIISEAKSESQKIIEQAVAQVKKQQESVQASLKQAGRDLLISLRKEINSMLERLIKTDIHQALNAEELVKIISSLIKNTQLSSGAQIIVSLSQQDKEKLEKGFLKQLTQETKEQIVLKTAHAIDSGFVISFDAGKSIFDFSNQALTEYLAGSLKPELNKILKSE